jgi:hypothetical protein
VDVEDVYVVGLELLQGCLERDAKRLRAITSIVDALTGCVVGVGKACRKFRSHDHLMANTTLLHPLTDPGLGLLVLVVVGAMFVLVHVLSSESFHKGCAKAFSRVGLRINKVTTVLVKEIEDLEDSLLVALAHHLLPRITKVHGSQTKRGDADACSRRHDAVEVQEGRGLGRVTEYRRHFECGMCV